jgi:CubicO group peptidase (beta-lactamase class C family)
LAKGQFFIPHFVQIGQLSTTMKVLIPLVFIIGLHSTMGQTIDSSYVNAINESIANGTYPNIHSILVSLDGKLVYEKYWTGSDEKYGKSIGVIAHGIDSLHSCRSVTKSFTSACIGIALQQGRIKSIDQNIFEFFPEHSPQNTGLKSQITIKDLLTMTAGFEWNEADLGSPNSSETIMGNSSDPVAYMFSLPMADTPGKVFNYNGGATQLLAAIIQKAAGLPIDKFANKFLFTPLGISRFEWGSTYGSDMPDAFSSLYLSSRDMLKFGLLYLNDGKWKTKQIIPAAWVKESLEPFIIANHGTDPRFGKSEYGYQWWILRDTIMNKPVTISACIGNGGQRIFIDKENKLVVVFTGGNYDLPDTYLNPYKLLTEFIYPAIITSHR